MSEIKTPEELEKAKQQQEAEEKAKQEAEAKRAEEDAKLLKLSPEEAAEYIKKLRSEAKERRLKEKEIAEKLAEFEKKQADEVEKDKKAKGKYEEVIADLKKKIAELEPEANEQREYIYKKKEAIKSSLEEKGLWVESFSNLKLSELEALDEKFKTPDKKLPTDPSNKFKSGNGKDERSAEEKMQGIYKTQ